MDSSINWLNDKDGGSVMTYKLILDYAYVPSFKNLAQYLDHFVHCLSSDVIASPFLNAILINQDESVAKDSYLTCFNIYLSFQINNLEMEKVPWEPPLSCKGRELVLEPVCPWLLNWLMTVMYRYLSGFISNHYLVLIIYLFIYQSMYLPNLNLFIYLLI